MQLNSILRENGEMKSNVSLRKSSVIFLEMKCSEKVEQRWCIVVLPVDLKLSLDGSDQQEVFCYCSFNVYHYFFKISVVKEMFFSVPQSLKVLRTCNCLWVNSGLQRLFATLIFMPGQCNKTTHNTVSTAYFIFVYSIFWKGREMSWPTGLKRTRVFLVLKVQVNKIR